MAAVLISGGTGLIGTRLSAMLTEKGHIVKILTRKINTRLQYPQVEWNPAEGSIQPGALQDIDYIINLAGAGIAEKRWTPQRKKELIESRVKSCQLIVNALREQPHKVKAVVSASAIGWYGRDEMTPGVITGYTENAAPDAGFLGQVCKAWEDSIEPVKMLNIRLVKVRVGLVLTQKGGALREFMKPLKFGIAAILGSGKQMQSWIHLDDICRIFIFAVENQRLEDAVNAVAPRPVDHKTLVLTLAKVIKGSFYISAYVPSFLLKLILGEMAVEVLAGTTVNCEKIKNAGFQFVFPSVEAALSDLANDV